MKRMSFALTTEQNTEPNQNRYTTLQELNFNTQTFIS